MKTLMTGLMAATALSLSPALAQPPGVTPGVSIDEPETGIVLTGTVEEVIGEDGFVMDYGDGTLAIATAQLLEKNPGFSLSSGDDVTVFAQTSEEFFADRIIDADAIFVESTDDFVRIAEPVAVLFYTPQSDPGMGSTAGVTGRITRMQDRLFQMDAGGQTITVDTSDMRYNPLDDIGRQQLDSGDVVVVYGPIDSAFMDYREIEANRITKMSSGRVSNDRSAMAARMDRNRMSAARPDRTRMDERRMNDRMTGDRDDLGGSMERGDRQAATRDAGPSEASDFDEFESYDRNSDGVLTLGEYVRIAARPANVSRSQAVRLFEALSRGDRLVTREEFLTPSSRFEELADRYLTPPSQ